MLKYIRNPIDYYYRYVLGVDEEDGVEEFVAANTLGTVVHESLRLLYEPLEGKSLTQDRLKPVLEKVDTVILDQFNSVYKKGDISSGKNLIIYEIAKRYVSNFITNEIALLQKGHRLQLVSVEKTYEVLLRLDAITFDIKLRGQIDRIDVFDGQPRIIDFKTGNVIQSDIEIVNWESIITDYTKNSKAFQVLFYSLLLEKDQNIKLPYEAGVISFKNLKAGFLKFSKKDKIGRGANKETLVNSEVINAFREQLEHLIIEILNPDKPFVAKELN